MKIAIAADHAGFALKQVLVAYLKGQQIEVLDEGTFDEKPVDYPDFAQKVAKEVSLGHVAKGIVVCGSGVGASVVANKFPGVRASVCHDVYSAHQGVEHDDMNVLALGSRVVGEELAKELVAAFVAARFSEEERHQRRLNKILELENQNMKG